MEEDILKYLPTVMFRGTPCIIDYCAAGGWYPAVDIAEGSISLIRFRDASFQS